MVPWDSTAHIDPILNMLHAWLLRVATRMPSISKPAELTAPLHKKINHELWGRNQDRQELKFTTQPHNEGPRTQQGRSKVQGFI